MAIQDNALAEISVNLEVENQEMSEKQLIKSLDEAYAKAKDAHLSSIRMAAGSCSGHNKITFEKNVCVPE